MKTLPRKINEYTIPANERPAGLVLGLNRLSSETSRTDDQRRREIDELDTSKLEVRHSELFNDQQLPDIQHWDFYYVDTSRGAVRLTLPSAPNNAGKLITIKLIAGSNNVTMVAPGSTIDGAATLTFNTTNASYWLYCTGTRWYIH